MSYDKPLVLVVEDKEWVCRSFSVRLEKFCRLLVAKTEAEAEKLFKDNVSGLDLIGMDACLSGKTPDTLMLTQRIRADWRGPIITTSSDPSFNKKLMQCGASYACEKSDFPEIAISVLDGLGKL
ncbi:MAG: response regulator [Patescibacteria group bacterium]